MQKFLLLTWLLLTISAKNYARTDSVKNIDAKDSIELVKDLMDIFFSLEKSSPYLVAVLVLTIGCLMFVKMHLMLCNGPLINFLMIEYRFQKCAYLNVSYSF